MKVILLQKAAFVAFTCESLPRRLFAARWPPRFVGQRPKADRQASWCGVKTNVLFIFFATSTAHLWHWAWQLRLCHWELHERTCRRCPAADMSKYFACSISRHKLPRHKPELHVGVMICLTLPECVHLHHQRVCPWPRGLAC